MEAMCAFVKEPRGALEACQEACRVALCEEVELTPSGTPSFPGWKRMEDGLRTVAVTAMGEVNWLTRNGTQGSVSG